MYQNNEISVRLQEWVKSTGKKKGEVATLLGISSSQFSQILAGKDGIGRMMKERLQKAGADVDWILTGRRDINDGGKKGELIARYIVAGHKKIVIETHEVPEGVRVDVYSQLQDYSNKTSLALVAEPVSEFEEIKQEVVIAPVQKVQKAAATAIHKQ